MVAYLDGVEQSVSEGGVHGVPFTLGPFQAGGAKWSLVPFPAVELQRPQWVYLDLSHFQSWPKSEQTGAD